MFPFSFKSLFRVSTEIPESYHQNDDSPLTAEEARDLQVLLRDKETSQIYDRMCSLKSGYVSIIYASIRNAIRADRTALRVELNDLYDFDMGSKAAHKAVSLFTEELAADLRRNGYTVELCCMDRDSIHHGDMRISWK